MEMQELLEYRVKKLESALSALFEQAEHEAQCEDADALIDVVKDIHEVTTEIRLLKGLLK